MKNLIVHEINEKVSDNFCNQLEQNLKELPDSKSKFLLTYPVVYIHDKKLTSGKHDVYVGESIDIISRTIEHYNERKNSNRWQNRLLKNDEELKMYVIGYEHFNKSFTLDIENKLFNYLMSTEKVDNTFNSRGNPQSEYYPNEEFDTVFSCIWKKLRKHNGDLFLSESEIKDSAVFKASPLHKLSLEQKLAKSKILAQIYSSLGKKLDHQLIFVEGEAGTGKTVLNSSTFYELFQNIENSINGDLTCCLMVNHDEQINVYKEIAKKLNIENANGLEVVTKPTSFINKISPEQMIDVAFVDEAHLLLTQGKQSYTGKNQLEDIMDRSRITIVMFDENQILTTEEYWEEQTLKRFKNLAISQGNYIELKNQMRMKAQQATIDWIDAITKENRVDTLHYDSSGYEIKIFDNPNDLYKAIKDKSKKSNSKLSRVVATYDWEYSIERKPEHDSYWNVKIGSFSKPWNRELYRNMDTRSQRKIGNLAWAEQPQTIDEIGSTFTIQGFDLSYVGVIIGPSVRYVNGRIEYVPENSWNKKATRRRTLEDGTKQEFGSELLQHELRVLLTRGVNGLYIYAVDEKLNNELKKSVEEYQYLRENNKNRHK